MKVRYSRLAIRQPHNISTYLEPRSPSAARHVAGQIRDAIQIVIESPEIGHEGAAAGTREFIVPGVRYVIVYRLYPRAGDAGELRIAGIYHSAQSRPGQRRPTDDATS